MAIDSHPPGIVPISLDKVQPHDFVTIQRTRYGFPIPSRIEDRVKRIVGNLIAENYPQTRIPYIEFENVPYGVYFKNQASDGGPVWEFVRALRDMNFKFTDQNEIERGDIVTVRKNEWDEDNKPKVDSETYTFTVLRMTYNDSTVEMLNADETDMWFNLSRKEWIVTNIERPSWKDIS